MTYMSWEQWTKGSFAIRWSEHIALGYINFITLLASPATFNCDMLISEVMFVYSDRNLPKLTETMETKPSVKVELLYILTECDLCAYNGLV